MKTPVAETFTLGRGLTPPAQRVFRLVSASRFDQDVWLMNTARRAGLDRVDLVAKATAVTDADAFDAWLTNVVTKIFEANVVCDMLAGVLVPEGETWSATGAAMTSTFIASLEDPDEKKALHSILARVVHSFLSSGPKS